MMKWELKLSQQYSFCSHTELSPKSSEEHTTDKNQMTIKNLVVNIQLNGNLKK